MVFNIPMDYSYIAEDGGFLVYIETYKSQETPNSHNARNIPG